MGGILTILHLRLRDLQELINRLRLHPVHLHLPEAVAAVREVAVAEAVEVAREAGRREVTKRFY